MKKEPGCMELIRTCVLLSCGLVLSTVGLMSLVTSIWMDKACGADWCSLLTLGLVLLFGVERRVDKWPTPNQNGGDDD